MSEYCQTVKDGFASFFSLFFLTCFIATPCSRKEFSLECLWIHRTGENFSSSSFFFFSLFFISYPLPSSKEEEEEEEEEEEKEECRKSFFGVGDARKISFFFSFQEEKEDEGRKEDLLFSPQVRMLKNH